MDRDFLKNFEMVVDGAMIFYLVVIAAIAIFLILRWRAFRPISTIFRRRKQPTPEEEKDADRRREKIRAWFWGGR